MRGSRIDANQPEVVRQLRAVPGVSVAITSDLGDGFPDLIIGFRHRNWMFELKDPDKSPSRRRLTEDQKRFFSGWKGQLNKVLTVEQILDIITHG